jgi:hypothetical protein
VQVFHETSQLSRALNKSEQWTRRAVGRGLIVASARTSRGCSLFSDEDVRRAKDQLGQADAASSSTPVRANG